MMHPIVSNRRASQKGRFTVRQRDHFRDEKIQYDVVVRLQVVGGVVAVSESAGDKHVRPCYVGYIRAHMSWWVMRREVMIERVISVYCEGVDVGVDMGESVFTGCIR